MYCFRPTVEDSDTNSDGPECLGYMDEDVEGGWEELAAFDFLDVERTSTLHRALYLPFLRRVEYQHFSLFQRESSDAA